jgi:sacsin
VDNLRSLINGHYLNVAPQTLLFTRVDTIKAEHRNSKGVLSQDWLIRGVRGHLNRDGGGKYQTLRVSTSLDTDASDIEEWLILSDESPLSSEKFQPLVTKHRLRDHVQVGLAANLTSRTLCGSLFATMPLPIPTKLPIHVNAPFILAPDRRSIRLDSDELEYNVWLLSQLAALYCCLLEALLSSRNQKSSTWWRWWPKQDPSNALVCSLYSSYVADTNMRICLDVRNNTMSPRDAIFLVDQNSSVARLLLRAQPNRLVQIPSYIEKALDGKIVMVHPEFVKDVIIRNTDHVKSTFSQGKLAIHDIKDIIYFLTEDRKAWHRIIGLPLLPLSDGTLATFGWSRDTTWYYAWTPSRHRDLFLSDRMIDPRFGIAQFDKDINVSKVNGLAVRDLLQDRISATMIDAFWFEFQQLKVEEDDPFIQQLAIVPTTTPGSYISLEKCATSAVIVMGWSELDMIPVLTQLGAIIIRRDVVPLSLRNILNKPCFPHFRPDTVLSFLGTTNSSLYARFSCVTERDHQRFAQWGREKMHNIAPNALTVARDLPIWPALEGTTNERFLSASKLIMLPCEVSNPSNVLPFLSHPSQFVGYSWSLQQEFKVEPLSFRKLRDSLDIRKNKFLRPSELEPYKSLLRLIVANHRHDSRDVLVPNSNLVLTYSCDLYARSQPLFCEAFHSQAYRLVRASFQDLEHDLRQFHLRQNMDFTAFQDCVTAINEDDTRGIDDSRLLYQWYCDELPILLAGDSHSARRMRALDSLHFIPPNQLRLVSYNRTPWARRTTRDLVRPKDVFCTQHEAVVWTQRVPFTPSNRLCMLDMSLGVPTAVEVVSASDQVEHIQLLIYQI